MEASQVSNLQLTLEHKILHVFYLSIFIFTLLILFISIRQITQQNDIEQTANKRNSE